MRSLLTVSTLALLMAGTAEAQRIQRSALTPTRTRVSLEQPRSSGSSPSFTMMGGLATGDGSLDMGIFLSTSFGWRLSGTSLVFRFDPSFGYYDGGNRGVDISQILLGLPVALEYEFRTVNYPRPYINGGVGLYIARVSVDDNDILDDGVSETESDLGFNIGGGLRFNNRLGFEVRVIDIDGFTTIPLLLTYRIN